MTQEETNMKTISINDRQAVAKTLNFGKYPILTIDLANRGEYGLKGCKVNIDNGTFRTGERYVIRATVRAYSDEKTLELVAENTCIKRSYGYSDVRDMLEWAAAPTITKDQDVVVAITNSELRCAYDLYIIHTGDRIDPNCMTPMRLEKLDLSKFF